MRTTTDSLRDKKNERSAGCTIVSRPTSRELVLLMRGTSWTGAERLSPSSKKPPMASRKGLAETGGLLASVPATSVHGRTRATLPLLAPCKGRKTRETLFAAGTLLGEANAIVRAADTSTSLRALTGFVVSAVLVTAVGYRTSGLMAARPKDGTVARGAPGDLPKGLEKGPGKAPFVAVVPLPPDPPAPAPLGPVRCPDPRLVGVLHPALGRDLDPTARLGGPHRPRPPPPGVNADGRPRRALRALEVKRTPRTRRARRPLRSACCDRQRSLCQRPVRVASLRKSPSTSSLT